MTRLCLKQPQLDYVDCLRDSLFQIIRDSDADVMNDEQTRIMLTRMDEEDLEYLYRELK